MDRDTVGTGEELVYSERSWVTEADVEGVGVSTTIGVGVWVSEKLTVGVCVTETLRETSNESDIETVSLGVWLLLLELLVERDQLTLRVAV